MIKIRNANISDLPELKSLFTESVRRVCCNNYTAIQIQAWLDVALNDQRWLDMIKNQKVVLAVNDNIILGFGSIDNFNYLDMFFVHAKYQRLGIANLIFNEIERIARDQSPLALWANVSITAVPFFKKKGFVIEKEQEINCQGIILNNFKMSKNMNIELNDI